ncbi:MAG: GIY-YIG nuclease family protein [Chloroflexi bacterium]|nr:GIY-YIG nuclease family protein [Chloroflexota bacterium]MYK62146.1 GIY-YIG nuclease family protein [Chloroflexota bacterium]
MSGIVYVLSNPAMSGIVKIGKTSSENPQVRIDTLFNTSVPVPFVCEIAVRVDDESGLEAAIFDLLDDFRINPKREFFRIHPERLKSLLQLISVEDVTPQINSENESIDQVSIVAGENLTHARPNFNFDEMGIPEDEEIMFNRTGETAKVASPKSVIFGDEEMTLTRATKIALGKPINSFVAPRPYWSYNGRSLVQIYDETYVFDE